MQRNDWAWRSGRDQICEVAYPPALFGWARNFAQTLVCTDRMLGVNLGQLTRGLHP